MDPEDKKKQRFPDNVIYQHVEQVFRPAPDWPSADEVLTMDEMMGSFRFWVDGDAVLLDRILRELHFRYDHNEHNGKWYWLVQRVPVV